MDQTNWGKIVVRIIAGIFFLSFCRTLSQMGNSNNRSAESRNTMATINAKNPVLLTLTQQRNLFRTQTIERWKSTRTPQSTRYVPPTQERQSQSPYLDSFMTQFSASAADQILGTPFVWNPPTRQSNRQSVIIAPTRTPHPTRTPRPALTKRSSNSIASSDSGDDTIVPTSTSQTNEDNVWSIYNHVDVDSLKSDVLALAGYWMVIVAPTFGILFLLNSIARIVINNSQDLATQKNKQSLARILVFLVGVLQLPIMVGFYTGVILWIVGFTTIYLSANSGGFHAIIGLIIFVVTSAIWISVMATLIRAFVAFHEPDGRNRYLLLSDEAPDLYQLLSEIARKLNTLPIQEIRLTPATHFEVFERGVWMPFPLMRRKRVLVLGMTGLQNMSRSQLTTLVTHQYQLLHLQPNDVGSLIVRGRDSINRLIERMEELRFNTTLNFIWHSFRLFRAVYHTVTYDVIMLYTLLVDCAIDQEYDLDSAVTHIDFMTELYDIHRKTQIDASLANRTPVLNIYQTMFNNEMELEKAANELDTSILYLPEYSDRYPPTQIRLQAISKSLAELTVDPPDTPVMNLFDDPDGLMHKMTILIMRQIPIVKYKRLR